MLKSRWNKMNKFRKRTFAAALTTAILSTSINVGSIAVNAGTSARGRVIVAFEDLPDEIAYQTVPIGGSRVDVTFPTELNVLLYTDEEEETTKEKTTKERATESEKVVVESGSSGSSSVKVAEEASEEKETVVVVQDNTGGQASGSSSTASPAGQDTGSGSSSAAGTLPDGNNTGTQEDTGAGNSGSAGGSSTETGTGESGAAQSGTAQDGKSTQEGSTSQESSTSQDGGSTTDSSTTQDSNAAPESNTDQGGATQDPGDQSGASQSSESSESSPETTDTSDSAPSDSGSSEESSSDSDSSSGEGTENTSGKNVLNSIMNAFAPVKAYAAESVVNAGAGEADSSSGSSGTQDEEKSSEPASESGSAENEKTESTDNRSNEEPAAGTESSTEERSPEKTDNTSAGDDTGKAGDTGKTDDNDKAAAGSEEKGTQTSQDTGSSENNDNKDNKDTKDNKDNKDNKENGSSERTSDGKTEVSGDSVSGAEVSDDKEEASKEGRSSSSSTVVSVSDADTEKEDTKKEDKGVRKLKDGEERVLKDVRWKIDKDKSEYGSRFQAVREGDVFIFVPDIKAYGLKSDVDLPEIRVTIGERSDADTASDNSASANSASENSASGNSISKNSISENSYPEFDQFAIVGGVRVRVTAPEGVFPEGAVLKVRSISDASDQERIENVIRSDIGSSPDSVSAENAGSNMKLLSFDITINDVSGNEIQPDTEHGSPEVTFSDVDMLGEAEEGSEVRVYHFDDDLGSASSVETSVDSSENAVSVTADHFSPWTVALLGAGDTSDVEIAEIWFVTPDLSRIQDNTYYHLAEYLYILGQDNKVYSNTSNRAEFLKIMENIDITDWYGVPDPFMDIIHVTKKPKDDPTVIVRSGGIFSVPDSIVFTLQYKKTDSYRVEFPNSNGGIPVTDIEEEGSLTLTNSMLYTLKGDTLSWTINGVTQTHKFNVKPDDASVKNITWEVGYKAKGSQDYSYDPNVTGYSPSTGELKANGTSTDQNYSGTYIFKAKITDGVSQGVDYKKDFTYPCRGGFYSYIIIPGPLFPKYYNNYAQDRPAITVNNKAPVIPRITWGKMGDTAGNVAKVEYAVLQTYLTGDSEMDSITWTDSGADPADGRFNISANELVDNQKNFIYARVTINPSSGNTYKIQESSEYILCDNIKPEISIISATITGTSGAAAVYAQDPADASKNETPSGIAKVYVLAREKGQTAPEPEEVKQKGVSSPLADTTIYLNGLDPSKQYTFYAVAEDKAGNLSKKPSEKKDATVNTGTVSGNITVNGWKYDTLQGSDAVEKDVLKEPKEITISANVTDGSLKSVQYYISDKFLASDTEIEKAAGGSWVTYNDKSKPVIKRNQVNYIYARFTQYDSASTVTYISSKGIKEQDDITASIQVMGNKYSSLQSKDEVESKTAAKAEEITINASVGGGGSVKSIQYYISSNFIASVSDIEKAAGTSWATYNDSAKPVLKRNQVNYIYAKVTPEGDSATPVYLSSKGIQETETVDASIVVNGKIYNILYGSDEIADTVTKALPIEINARVSGGSVRNIQYFISDQFMSSEAEIEKAAGTGWSNYNMLSKPYLKTNQVNYIYAKITQNDDKGTVLYISTKGIRENESIQVTVSVNGKTYDAIQSTEGVEAYINKNKEITITATPRGTSETSKVKSVQYFITSEYLPSAAAIEKAADVNWSTYDASAKPLLKTNQLNYVYVKAVQNDSKGTPTYVSTKGIWEDETAPKVTSITETPNDKKTAATVTVSGNDSESGIKVYYLLALKKSESAPDANTIKTKGQNNTTGIFKIDSISASDPNIYYAVIEDKAGNLSAVAKQSGLSPAGDVSATISVLDKNYSTMNSSSKIGGYTKENKTFSITASSKGSEIKTIEYFISDKLITSKDELEKAASDQNSSKIPTTKTTVKTNKDGTTTMETTTGEDTTSTGKWSKYDDGNKPYLKKNQLNYIYARITQDDTEKTKTYISTEGIWEDEIKPTVTSVKGTPKDTSSEVVVKGNDKQSGIKSYYLVAKPASEEAPKEDEDVKSGTENETGKFSLSGLKASTAYALYAVIEDNAGNISVLKKGKFTTQKSSSGAGAGAGAGKGGKGSSGTGDSNAAKRKSSSSSKAGKGSGSGSDSSASAIRDGVPFIEDASQGILIGRAKTSGWDRIENETGKAVDADWISVDMNGSTVVPKTALAKIAGRDVTYYFVMNDDVTWAVNGLSFDGSPKSDIDFRVRLDTRNIPAKLINEIADVYPHTNISIEHDGDFGFTAILSLFVGKQGDGMYGNLYYYNEGEKSLEFVESAPVDGSGRSSFEFKHASDYTVIIRGDSLTSKTAEALAAAGLDGAGGTTGRNNKGINGGPGNISRNSTRIWLLVVSIISFILCGFILFMPDKRKKRGRYQGA